MSKKLATSDIQDKLKASALDACAKNGYNPFEELVEIAQHKERVIVKGQEHYVHTATTDQRITIAKEIASYLSPKVKNVDGQKNKDYEFHLHFTQFGDNKSENTPVTSRMKNITPKITPLES